MEERRYSNFNRTEAADSVCQFSKVNILIIVLHSSPSFLVCTATRSEIRRIIVPRDLGDFHRIGLELISLQQRVDKCNKFVE